MFELSFKDPNRLGRRLMEKDARGRKASERKYKAQAAIYERRQQVRKNVMIRQQNAHERALDRGSRLAWMKEPAEKRPWAKK